MNGLDDRRDSQPIPVYKQGSSQNANAPGPMNWTVLGPSSSFDPSPSFFVSFPFSPSAGAEVARMGSVDRVRSASRKCLLRGPSLPWISSSACFVLFYFLFVGGWQEMWLCGVYMYTYMYVISIP